MNRTVAATACVSVLVLACVLVGTPGPAAAQGTSSDSAPPSHFLVRIGGSYLFHQHPKDELYIVLEGELAVDFDGGETIVLRKGDSLVARAGRKHRSRSDEGAVALIFKDRACLRDQRE